MTIRTARNTGLAVLLAIAAAAPAGAAIIHVPADYAAIQPAIDAASDGDVVVIAPGTYTGWTNRDLDFGGKAITVRSADPDDPAVVAATIIDALQLGRGFILQSGETASSVIDGLTIVNGFADRGPAVYLTAGSGGTIRNCVMSGHTAPDIRGVVESFNAPLQSSDLVLTDCTIEGNSGGGVASFALESLTMDRCRIAGCSGGGVVASAYGAGVVDVRDCTIEGNAGVGMSVTGSLVQVLGSAFVGNGGTGLFVEEAFGGTELEVSNCTITDNTSTNNVGGLSCVAATTALVRNCLVAGNAGYNAGGMAMSGFGGFEVRTCTFTGNSSVLGGGGIRAFGADPVSIESCIIWNNDAPEGPQLMLDSGFNDPSVVTVGYSDLEGGGAAVAIETGCCSPSQLILGASNVDEDPLFTDAAAGDFHLASGSPLIDAGDPAFAGAGETDLDGDPRVVGGRVDMGADEFRAPGDLDGDGAVGFSDLLALLAVWGPCPDCAGCPGDLNGDCIVGFADLLAVLAGWS